MKNQTRPIFREEVVKRYFQSGDESVFPKIIAPKTFVCLWIFIGLFLIGLLIAWSVTIPVYTVGQGIVVSLSETHPEIPHDVALAVFLPAEYQDELNIGQHVFVYFDPHGEISQQKIIEIDPRILSPEEAKGEYAASQETSVAITCPVSVVFVPFVPPSGKIKADSYIGSLFRTDIELGRQRILAFVPGVGGLFRA
jgi:hypothetical protein